MEGMKRYPDKHFELAIVDPPYGIDITGIWGDEKYGYKQYEDKKWDKTPPSLLYFLELERISLNQIIWGANHFISQFPLKMQDSSCWLLWDKGQRDFTFADGELAWTSFKTSLRIFNLPRANAMINNKNTGGKIHVAQKPVKLYEWLLKNYAKPGDKILDTHGGSMSIAIACYNLDFDLTLFEIDKDYFEAGKARLEEHMSQQRLFDI